MIRPSDRFPESLLLACLLLFSGRLQAQGDEPRVSARLSAGVLRMGDTGAISVVVENAEDARIVELPAVAGLSIGKPGRPSTQQYTSFVNGRLFSQISLTWSLTVRPEAEGDYEIPAIVVESGGRRYSTQPLHLTVVVDLQGEDLGYLEIRPSSARVVEGQSFTVELVFGWDASLEVNYAELNLPWWESLPGAIELESRAIPQDKLVAGIGVNRGLEVAAERIEARERSGRSFIALRLTKSYLPTRSGTLEFPTSFFEFGRRARASLFDTRPPRRESHFVQAAPFSLQVVALPAAGQPLDFSGAVGSLAVRASADPRDVRVGDSIKLALEWTGQGNLEFFRAPDPGSLDAFRGFRVYGSTEEKSFERRKVVYDLSPLSTEVREIPPVSLSVFDPESGAYEAVASEPIPIRVRPLEKASGLGDDERRFERDIADIDAQPLGGEERLGLDPSDGVVLGAFVGLPLAGLATRAVLRRRAGDPGAPLERRRRKARKRLAAALAGARDAREEMEAFLDFLAARTREKREAWIGRDFARWAAGQEEPLLSPELRERGASLVARLEAAVYGASARVGGETIRQLAEALEVGGL